MSAPTSPVRTAPPTVEFTVFTKPWRMPLPELAAFVRRLGFDGIELPVRPGYQVEPGAAATGLPAAAALMREHGLHIRSIAGPADEETIAACAEAGVPLIRVMVDVPDGRGYLSCEAEARREFEALVPALQRYGVAVGVQNHCGRSVGSAMGLRHLLEGFDPRQVCAVWDPAHCALDGEPPELAADIVWSHLRMCNLKNAVWRRRNGPEAETARYDVYWTSGRQGLARWDKVAAELRARGFAGVVCLSAEYSAEGEVERLIAEDIGYARSLFAG